MSQIDGNKFSEICLNFALNHINNIIKTLSSYEGKVFGEYVREVVVPRMKNPACTVVFNSIDIWFKNEINKDNFIEDSFIKNSFIKETNISENIDVKRQQYKYDIYENFPIKFNIVVSLRFPMYDFDVNDLTYFYRNGNPIVEINLLENKLDQIINAITMKEATMMKNYFDNMVNHHLTYPERAKMINELYENRGWSIFCEGIRIISPFIGTRDDAIAKQIFLNKSLLERAKQESKEDREIKLMKEEEFSLESKQDIKKKIFHDFGWSRNKADEAEDKNVFINVGGVRFSTRLLSGATRSWTSDDLDEQKRIFNLDCRITGTPKNVTTTLKLHGVEDSQITKILENSITKDNYQSTKKTEYLEEIERHKNSKLNSLDKKEIPENTLERRKKLINDFKSADKLFKAAIINRNKAFFECISDFDITDKLYISDRIIEYPEELSSKIIIEELNTKK